MAKNGKGKVAVAEVQVATKGGEELLGESQPRSLRFAADGIRTSRQFAGMMSALMSDILDGKVSPQTGNAVVNAGGKLLKVVEMQLKYGAPSDTGKILALTADE